MKERKNKLTNKEKEKMIRTSDLRLWIKVLHFSFHACSLSFSKTKKKGNKKKNERNTARLRNTVGGIEWYRSRLQNGGISWYRTHLIPSDFRAYRRTIPGDCHELRKVTLFGRDMERGADSMQTMPWGKEGRTYASYGTLTQKKWIGCQALASCDKNSYSPLPWCPKNNGRTLGLFRLPSSK